MSDMSAEATAIELDDDKFHDECGLFGIWNHAEAANVVYLGLYALQHRGQESAGIASTDGDHFQVEKAMGWVADVFSRDRLKRLPGHRSIGHVRYSTAGSSNLRNAQPITGTTAPDASTASAPVAARIELMTWRAFMWLTDCGREAMVRVCRWAVAVGTQNRR